jgi:hypothetical protein
MHYRADSAAQQTQLRFYLVAIAPRFQPAADVVRGSLALSQPDRGS